MEFKKLQQDMIAALKAGDKTRKDAISMIIAAVKKVAIDEGTRDAVSDELTDRVILKEMKSAREQVDTCPAARTDLLEKYTAYLNIVTEYAPKQMTEDEIIAVIREKFADVLASGNKGMIMKAVMPEFKGKADGKLISAAVAKICG